MLLLMLLMLFWLLAPTTPKRLQTICVFKDYINLNESYYRPGDLIIGGILPLGIIAKSPFLDFKTLEFLLNNVRRNTQLNCFFALNSGTRFRNSSCRISSICGLSPAPPVFPVELGWALALKMTGRRFHLNSDANAPGEEICLAFAKMGPLRGHLRIQPLPPVFRPLNPKGDVFLPP
ncbi:hypothetical protein E2320_000147, partial [Naja naja]